MPASIALNQGMPPIFTTTPMTGLSGEAWATPVTPVRARLKTPARNARFILSMLIISSLWGGLRVTRPCHPGRTNGQHSGCSLALSGRSPSGSGSRVSLTRVHWPQARGGGRGPDANFAGKLDMDRGRPVTPDPRAQPLPEQLPHLANRLANGGQGRGPSAHPRIVVEADQRDILWRAKTALGHRRQDGQGCEIGQRLNGGRRPIPVKPLGEPRRGHVDAEAQLDDGRFGQAERAQRFARARATLPDIGERQRGSGDQDMSMTQFNQVSRANGASLFVVDRDGVRARVAGDTIRNDIGSFRGLDDVPARKLVSARNDDETSRTPRENRLQFGPFRRLFAVGAGNDHLVTVLAHALLDR